MHSSVILNGRKVGPELLRTVFQALAEPAILIERGGFLFKATLDEKRVWLDVVPCILDGTRRYHYNMKLAEENAFTLSGAVNANGLFTILFTPSSKELSDSQRSGLQIAYRRFAQLLIANGYLGEGKLDWCTLKLLDETGICRPPPESLADLSKHGDDLSQEVGS